jgi:hypothetical protein
VNLHTSALKIKAAYSIETSVSVCWNTCDLAVRGTEQKDFQAVLRAAAETNTMQGNIPEWLQLDEGDTGYQLLTEQEDFHAVLRAAAETDTTQGNIRVWFQLDEGDPGYQLLSEEEIATKIF